MPTVHLCKRAGPLAAIAPDGGSIVGIYFWENRAAANAFYASDWVAIATKRWAALLQRQERETSMVAESTEWRILAAQ